MRSCLRYFACRTAQPGPDLPLKVLAWAPRLMHLRCGCDRPIPWKEVPDHRPSSTSRTECSLCTVVASRTILALGVHIGG